MTTHRSRTFVAALAATVAVLPATTAGARPMPADSPQMGDPAALAELDATLTHPAAHSTTPFQWDDAGIGAAGALALIAAGALTLSRGRLLRRHGVHAHAGR